MRDRGQTPNLSIGVLTRDVNVLHAACQLSRRPHLPRSNAGFDWAALRRAMLLQIEVEAAPMLRRLLPCRRRCARRWSSARTPTPSGSARRGMMDGARRRSRTGWAMRPPAAALHARPAFPFDGPVPAGPGGLRDAFQPDRTAGDQRPGAGCAAASCRSACSWSRLIGKDAPLLAAAALLRPESSSTSRVETGKETFTKAQELRSFLFLSVVMAPVLAVHHRLRLRLPRLDVSSSSPARPGS